MVCSINLWECSSTCLLFGPNKDFTDASVCVCVWGGIDAQITRDVSYTLVWCVF